MKKDKGIKVVLVVFVILGTTFASVNYLAALVPSVIYQDTRTTIMNNEYNVEFVELDYLTVSDVSRYLLEQADYNEIKFTTQVYSAVYCSKQPMH